MEKITIKLTLRDMKNVVNTTTFQILKNINDKGDSNQSSPARCIHGLLMQRR